MESNLYDFAAFLGIVWHLLVKYWLNYLLKLVNQDFGIIIITNIIFGYYGSGVRAASLSRICAVIVTSKFSSPQQQGTPPQPRCVCSIACGVTPALLSRRHQRWEVHELRPPLYSGVRNYGPPGMLIHSMLKSDTEKLKLKLETDWPVNFLLQV